MRRPLLPARFGLLSVLSVAACAPPTGSSPPRAAPPAKAAPAGAAAAVKQAALPERTRIAGPEASRITYAHLGRQPPLGARLPRAIQYAPGGKLITYLQRQADGPEQALFAFDTTSREIRQLVASGDLLKDAKPLSREEELRRERQRMFSKGITAYSWAKRAEVALIPFGGDVFLRDSRDPKGAIARLTDTPEPEIDPKVCDGGERVVFVRGRELFMIDVASRRETALTRGAPEGVSRGLSDFNGQEEFDEPSGFWISPGCDRVAYLEVDERQVEKVPVLGFRGGKEDLMMARYPRVGGKNPRVRAGILDLATRKTTWLTWKGGDGEGERYLGRFAWAEDGKALWFQTLSRDQKRLSLLRARPRSGEAAEVVVETSPTWVDFADMRLLERSPRFVWSTAESGHRHLALRDADSGAEIARLTEGDWDVTSLLPPDEERGLARFVATKERPTERHLYTVPLAGGEVKRLTSDPGMHQITVDPRGPGYVELHAALDRPWKGAVRGADNAEVGALPAPVDRELAELELRAPEIVEVRAASGDTLYGALLAPRRIEPGRRYPVVVSVYGGPGVQTVFNSWSPWLLWNHLADRGVVVFQLDNRGSANRGRAFESAIYGRLGEVELADQIAGLDFLKTLPYVDAGRVGIYGHSYGGRMALDALLMAPDRFHVGVAGSPVTDDRLYDTGYTERYMGLLDKDAARYEATDLTKRAGNLRGKLLLMHGLMDENVHFAHTAKMIEALMAADKRFDTLVFPGERHGYRSPAASHYANRAIVEYLTEHL
ncbi:S9 family peptidase [Sorangium atrum]|uniref:Alpha/beta fold hydrolase n=1 Tax=Sorangium atrum TaxID=2995308 RepID=A0ABT5BQM8_9BACT|nr:alpha/beta fold hydrolase [Sorangium aterium]MDC0676460.1 alpha/beta fold hydrolase [Sorangium aterium]